ncbi:MAG: MotA/TolQ/ExbB proton channel family protein [Bacteroidales bacterium]|nr:MotA/TolQ/ExbB proton channel family protein [Bacteroidales bacterium]
MFGLFKVYPITLLPFICGLIVIVVGYIKLWKLRRINRPGTVLIFEIWLIGIIAFLLGFFGQLVTMIQAFDAISMAGDINPTMVADALKGSYRPILIGLSVLIISLIVWGILKGTKENRINTVTLIDDDLKQ